ncbi:MAG: nucleotidyl transferase AbiEii/AbiGii toxin family protein [Saprospiraceae bacterium]
MKNIEEIRGYYPVELQDRQENLLREYLQYEILKILFESAHGHKFTFLGGTCLRIVYGTERFSEDLDFDNVGLSKEEFEETAATIQDRLAELGYEAHLKFAYKGAFHCNVRFPGLLFHYQLSGHKEARVLIKIDTEKQHFEYDRSMVDLDKFGVQARIAAVPLSLLCSMKIAAVMGRKRPKGRDFYDLIWILARTTPDYAYTQDRFNVSTAEGLRELVRERIAPFDFEMLMRDVEPFLFDREVLSTVRNFPAFWEDVRLN